MAERDRVQPGDVVGLVKIMKSFHEVKSEEGGMVDRVLQELGLASMAVYSQADADAFHVRKADQSTEIGKAAARHSYLNPQALLDAARSSGADAVSPGYGFVAENADFAGRCEAAGLIWVGPSPEAIDRLGDKAAARL